MEKNSPRQIKLRYRKLETVNHPVGVDLLETGDEEFGFILVMRDMFSGAMHLHSMNSKTAPEALCCLLGYISKFGYPKNAIMDTGTEIKGEFMKI